MSEIKVNSIKGVSASTAAISIDNSSGSCTANITNNLSNRNLIINGSQIIDQRNSGSAITVSPNTSVYTTDRFTIFEATNGVVTAQQSTTAPDGFTKSLKIDCTTIDSTIATLQRLIVTTKIEGNNIAHLGFGSSAAKNVVLSFYVKSNLTGSFSGAISNSANNRVYIYSYTINSANTWERKTIPIVGDTTGTWLTTNGIGLNITWALALGATYGGTAGAWGTVDKNGATNQVNFLSSTDNEWLITGAQFEIDNGSGVASDFEHRSYGKELALAQRYFTLINADGSIDAYSPIGIGRFFDATQAQIFVPLPTAMRHPPTIEAGSTTAADTFAINSGGSLVSADCNSVGLNERSFTSVTLIATSSSISGQTTGMATTMYSHNTDNAKLGLTAEL